MKAIALVMVAADNDHFLILAKPDMMKLFNEQVEEKRMLARDRLYLE